MVFYGWCAHTNTDILAPPPTEELLTPLHYMIRLIRCINVLLNPENVRCDINYYKPIGWPSRRCKIPGKGERSQGPLTGRPQDFPNRQAKTPPGWYTGLSFCTKTVTVVLHYSSCRRNKGTLVPKGGGDPPPPPKIEIEKDACSYRACPEQGVGHRVPVLGFLLVSFIK